MIPIARKLKKLIDENGLVSAVQKYRELKNNNTKKYDFSAKQSLTLVITI